MKRIETLTTEQIDRIPEWVEKWTRIGLCSDPADFDAAERAARSCYASAGYRQPTMVLRMGSPMGATIGGVYAALLLGRLGRSAKSGVGDIGRQVEYEIDRQVHDRVDRRIGACVDERVDERVDMEVRDLVCDKVDRQLLGHVDRQVCDHATQYVHREIQADIMGQLHAQAEVLAHEQVSSSLYKQTIKQVREDVWTHVSGQVDEALFQSAVDEIDGQVVGHTRLYWHHYRACQLWAGWYAYVTFFRDVCRWENDVLDAFVYDEILAKACGWSWWGKDVCALSDRPLTIKRNEQGQLHCTDGPAMVYRDGWAIWALGGVCVDERVVRRGTN